MNVRDQSGLILDSSIVDNAVANAMAVIIGQKRRITRCSEGPVNSCQRLVTSEGMMRIAAAVTGDMKLPSKPMATVGKPIPVTPLTRPADRKMAVNAKANERGSFMPLLNRS